MHPNEKIGLKTSLSPSIHRHYSHIYYEEDISELIDKYGLRQKLAGKFIPISHYKDVFNRPNQDWRVQKQSQKLILARRKEHFLYDGSEFTPSFGNQRFFYNAMALNCPFDCEYCYLQGMFPSANAVMFLNNGDYLSATKEELKKGPIYLALSYDTDLPAFEYLVPYCKEWLDFAKNEPDLEIEIRTKSRVTEPFENSEVVANAILAWTISPQQIIDSHEPKTAGLKQRLRAAKKVSELGWRLRICIDPILKVPGWKTFYSDLISAISEDLNLENVFDFSLGTFRISSGYLRNMRKQRPTSPIITFPYETKDQIAGYNAESRHELLDFVRSGLTSIGIDERKISVTDPLESAQSA